MSIIEELDGIISGSVKYDDIVLDCYSVDSSPYSKRPKAVAYPVDATDVSKIVGFAIENKIDITPRGGGTGLVGGCIGTGIIIDLCKINHIELESSRNYVTVGAGVPKGRLDAELDKIGKFLGPNPSVGPYCTLGGMIATNASGSRSLKYGSVIDNILKVEFVDGRGELKRLPDDSVLSSQILKIAENTDAKDFPSVAKNSCGYRLDRVISADDVHKILAGSEGTLGIIVSARLKIFSKPPSRILHVYGYESISDAVSDCEIIGRAKPAALEFVDRHILANIGNIVPSTAECLLFAEFDSDLEKTKTLGALKGSLIKKASTESEIKKWWSYRDRSLSYSLQAAPAFQSESYVIEDAAVPVKYLGELLSLIKKIEDKFGIRTIVYGHAGSGNLHVRPVSGHTRQGIAKAYFEAINKMGGTITAEHGDGIARSEFVRQQYGEDIFAEFSKLKNLMDPNNILNSGKVIPRVI